MDHSEAIVSAGCIISAGIVCLQCLNGAIKCSLPALHKGLRVLQQNIVKNSELLLFNTFAATAELSRQSMSNGRCH